MKKTKRIEFYYTEAMTKHQYWGKYLTEAFERVMTKPLYQAIYNKRTEDLEFKELVYLSVDERLGIAWELLPDTAKERVYTAIEKEFWNLIKSSKIGGK